MAQRINVILVDDINGKDADETVTFGLDGVAYEIDLAEANAADLRAALTTYISAGRKVGGKRRKAKVAAAGGTSAADIRQWARDNGWDVPDRGRVAAEVRQAYAAAH